MHLSNQRVWREQPKWGMFWLRVWNCLVLLDYIEMLVRVLWALVCHVLQDHTLILNLEMMCPWPLYIIIGLNSCTLIVIASRVWVCPWLSLESSTGSFEFRLGLSSRRLFVFQVLCCSFRMSRQIVWVNLLKVCYSANVSCPISPNIPTDGIFKSVYLRLKETRRHRNSDEELLGVANQEMNKSFWSDFCCLRLREFLKLVNPNYMSNKSIVGSKRRVSLFQSQS